MPYFDPETMGGTWDQALADSDAMLFGAPHLGGLRPGLDLAGRRPLRRPLERDPQVPRVPPSRTLGADDLGSWANTSLLPADDAVGAIRELRDREGRGLLVMGSPSLTAQLVAADLVDEYRLMIEPILLGGGKSVFPHPRRRPPLELVSVTTAATGVLVCTYRAAGRP